MSNEHYDAVIVGSGFGGSVMAYRLAEAGLRVCLLERGKAYSPGSFARTPYQVAHNFWDPSEGRYGLYNAWNFARLTAVVSSGLGGGSLIYSNVMLRKDEKWFVKEDPANGGYEYWPVTRADLDLHYDRVEKMLRVQRYPMEHAPYSTVGRPLALKEAAERLHLNWCRPPLAVSFADGDADPVPGAPIHEHEPNIHGVRRSTCRLCGECNLGCNFGSKNSLDYTYLTEAKQLGAKICTLCEVRAFHPVDGGYGGYVISYVQHDAGREGKPLDTHDPLVLPPTTITADRLILSAGALGTPFLLLRNYDAFRDISPKLGSHFSGNGDFVSVASQCRHNDGGNRLIEASYGPAITGMIRIPDALDTGEGDTRGFYIQDAGYPNFVNWITHSLNIPGLVAGLAHEAIHLAIHWVKNDPETDVGSQVARLLGSYDTTAYSLPMGGMGRDYPTGTMHLQNGKLFVDENDHLSDSYYARVHQQMEEIAEALGGQLTDDFLWKLNRLVTVHPLGGCPMGRTPDEGVVDTYGKVFNYANLYVADGSVMPGPVGANPSLTIAALADRTADAIIAKAREP